MIRGSEKEGENDGGVHFSIASLLGRRGTPKHARGSAHTHYWACCEQHRQRVLASIASSLFPADSKEARAVEGELSDSEAMDEHGEVTPDAEYYAAAAAASGAPASSSSAHPRRRGRADVLLALQRALDVHGVSSRSQNEEINRVVSLRMSMAMGNQQQ